jgi:hypothetical protein
MDVRVYIFVFVLSYVGTGPTTDRSAVQGVLSNVYKGFIVSEVNSES